MHATTLLTMVRPFKGKPRILIPGKDPANLPFRSRFASLSGSLPCRQEYDINFSALRLKRLSLIY